MAAPVPFAGLRFLHRLLRSSNIGQRRPSIGCMLPRRCKCRWETRTISSGSVTCGGDGGEKTPLSAALTSGDAPRSPRRRALSPVERLSALLPDDALSPEVMQLRERDQDQREPNHRPPATHCAPADSAQGALVAQEDPGEAAEPDASGPSVDGERGAASPTLPGESLLAFGELLVAENRKRRAEFRKMFQLQTGTRLQSSWGVIEHDALVGRPAACFVRTSLRVPILIRRASLEDYVLYMRRGPAIAYPKDASIMLLMMDVTEGDCVLESGSGSGAMSLLLSRAVGSKGRVLSVEVREDHHKRAVLNYRRWRTSWNLRRGEEWPDNVQFHKADLSTASSLLTGQGFHAVALDMMNPHLALPAVIPHLHYGAVCAVYLANISQVIDLLEGLRCSALPLLCERIVEVPIRDWLVAPALQKDGRFCSRKAPVLDEDQREDWTSEDTDKDKMSSEQQPPFGTVPYIARPNPEQMSHTAFLVKLRKVSSSCL